MVVSQALRRRSFLRAKGTGLCRTLRRSLRKALHQSLRMSRSTLDQRGPDMRKLALVVTGIAWLAVMPLASDALADETCHVSRSYPVDEFAEDYFVDPHARSLTPLLLTESMLENGCTDAEIFDQVIAIFLDDRTPGLFQSEDVDPWQIDDSWVRIVTELLMLGHDEPIRKLLADLQSVAEAGDPAAMMAFAHLGERQTSSLDWQRQEYRRGAYRRYDEDFPKSVEFFDMAGWVESTNHPILTIAPDLGEEAPRYMARASRAGFAPAHIFHLANQELRRFMPCRAVPSAGRNFLGVPLESDEEDEEQPRNRFLEAFSQLPDRESVAQDLIDWSRDIITESFEWDRDRRRHPYALNAAWVAYGYAGIRSNCAFSTEDHIMDFGVEDLDEAAIGLQYAIMAPGRLVPIHESLVFAWVIDTFYENPDRHYAAARFLQQGAYRETLDFHDDLVEQFVGRLSRETIREAQKIMAEHGYYTAAIDGIPGPNFLSGLRQWSYFCEKDRGMHLDKCLWTPQTLADAEWAQPYIADVLARY